MVLIASLKSFDAASNRPALKLVTNWRAIDSMGDCIGARGGIVKSTRSRQAAVIRPTIQSPSVVDSLLLDAFDAAACEEIVAELRAAHGAAATVYGKSATGAVEPAVRKATRLTASDHTRDRVMARLEELESAIEGHFNVTLSRIEELQFLRYVTGDYFVAHQDGNTPLIRDDSRFRKISIVIFLSEPSAYDGGSLLIHGSYPEKTAVAAPQGTLIAFPSETTHEVAPLTRGERFTVVSWYR